MIYEFNSGNLNIYQDGILNITQPYNPITQEAFKDEEEALDWLYYYIKSTHNTIPTKATMTATSMSDDEDIEFSCDGNKIVALADEPFKVNFKINGNCINSPVVMRVVRITDKTKAFNSDYREYKLTMKNSKCSKNLILEDTGVYRIWLEGLITCDDGTKVLVQSIDEFTIEIV